MNNKLPSLFVSKDCTIRDALKKMDLIGEKLLIVINKEEHLLGVLTDGDIRRFILNNGSLQGKIEECYNRKPIYLNKNTDPEVARNIMLKEKIEAIPIVDSTKRVVDYFVWSKLFNGRRKPSQNIVNAPVVIMAGGRGERLDPFTKILPKPLIPVGDKPVVEVIMDKFSQFGINQFYLTLNYKGEVIKSYFDNIDAPYKINYIWEKEYLGTAGSLKYLPVDIAQTIIVSNCDVVVDIDYADLIRVHEENDNDLTIVGSVQHHVIHYGVIEFSINGNVNNIIEKPEYDFTVNTGVYTLRTSALNYIPENKLFHFTDLVQILLENNRKVSMYPVSEKSYMDVGQWTAYKKSLDQFIKI